MFRHIKYNLGKRKKKYRHARKINRMFGNIAAHGVRTTGIKGAASNAIPKI